MHSHNIDPLVKLTKKIKVPQCLNVKISTQFSYEINMTGDLNALMELKCKNYIYLTD